MKKSLKLFTLVFALLFAITVKVNATDVADAASLATCIAGAGNTEETKAICNLTNDIELTNRIELLNGKHVEISLNNKKITVTGNALVFNVKNGVLKLTGPGEISGPISAIQLLTSDGVKAEVVVGKDVEVFAETGETIAIYGKGSKLDVYGVVKTTSENRTAITGNGTEKYGSTVINIYEGAVVNSEKTAAIYHPQSGELNVFGGEITGITGIEMRAGKLMVKGGTIIGTAISTETNLNGSGGTTTGAGIAIVQHTTGLDLSTVIEGGTIKGHTALYHNNTQNNSAEAAAKVTLDVTGGSFEATNGGTNAIYSDAKEEFVKGGEFVGKVDEKFVSEDLEAKVIDGVTYIGESIPKEEVKEEVKNPDTGDNIMLFVILGLISLITAGYTINKLRKNA